MPNFIIIPEKQTGFTGKPLFLSSGNLLLEKEIPMFLYTGSLHYNFSTKYEALPNIEHKLAELTFVLTNGNKYFIGIKYAPPLEAPVITIKGAYVAAIKKYCAENNIPIVNKKPLAAKLYECNSGEYIPVECYKEAAKIISKIFERQSAAYNDCGCTHTAKGDYDRAITDFTKAIQLDPDFAEAYNNRGDAYIGKDDYDRAIAELNRAINLKPTLVKAYINRACAYYLKDNFAQARADADTALQIDPNDQDAHLLNKKLEKEGY
jgi:tetratricopeptide (TPR) repeat protein